MAKHARSQRRAVNQRAQDAEARLAELEQASAAASSTAAEVADRARCLARALHSTRDRGTALHDAIAGLDDIERLATSSLSSDARHPRPCSLSEQRAGHADDERGSGRRSQPTRTTPRGQSTPFYTSKRMRGVSHHDLARESSMHASGRSPSAATMPPHEAVPRSTPSASHTPHNTASRRHVLQSYPPEREISSLCSRVQPKPLSQSTYWLFSISLHRFPSHLSPIVTHRRLTRVQIGSEPGKRRHHRSKSPVANAAASRPHNRQHRSHPCRCWVLWFFGCIPVHAAAQAALCCRNW
jgi:hypothetical protein